MQGAQSNPTPASTAKGKPQVAQLGVAMNRKLFQHVAQSVPGASTSISQPRHSGGSSTSSPARAKRRSIAGTDNWARALMARRGGFQVGAWAS